MDFYLEFKEGKNYIYCGNNEIGNIKQQLNNNDHNNNELKKTLKTSSSQTDLKGLVKTIGNIKELTGNTII